MPLFEIFVALLIAALFGFALLALLAAGIGARLKKWTFVKWCSRIGTAAAILAGIVIFSLWGWSRFEGDFPFLRVPPIEAELLGTYSLHPNSVRRLQGIGYTNLVALIIVKEDKTFEIRQIPHTWLYGFSYRAGYDTCFGKWEAKRISESTVYNVVARIERFSADSAYESDPEKGVGTLGWVGIGIAAKTKKRNDYTLAVPLNYGDEGYILFVKQNTNETVGPHHR